MNDAAPASGYAEAYAAWRADPEAWWAGVAEGITWERRWDSVFDASIGPYGRWFPGATLNTCFNCIDRHVLAGRGEQAALIWDSPMTGRIETFTYRQMQTRTAKLAGALAALGVARGDRVVIYLPMVPEAAIAMLACARLGAIHSVVFGGFAAAELASRIADAKPKVIVSASCGLEPGRVVKYKPLLDAAIALSPHKPDACLILQRDAERADTDRRARPRSGRGRGGGVAARSGPGGGDRSALHPLHVGHDGTAEGRGARQWRACGRAVELDAHALRRRCRRRVLGGVRCRLGGRPLLHRLRAAAARLHQRDVRGQAGRHAGCRRVLAGVRAAWREGAVHRADRDAGDQAAGPRGQAAARLRSVEAGGAVPRRRALRSADRGVGGGAARQAGGRPLVADRDRLGDHRRLPPVRAVPVQARLRRAAEPGHRPARAGRRGARGRGRARPAICAPGCRCRPAARRRCGRTTRATAPPICRISPAGTAPAMPARSTRRAMSG